MEPEKAKPLKRVTYSYGGRDSMFEYDRDGKFQRHADLATYEDAPP